MFENLFSAEHCGAALEALLQERKTACPQMQIVPFGKSSCGQKLYAAALGRLKNPVLFVGGLSAQDRMSTILLLRFLWDMTNRDDPNSPCQSASLQKFFEYCGVLILPLLNPDGFDIARGGPETAGALVPLSAHAMQNDPAPWEANAAGTSLKHNFNAAFPYDTARSMHASPSGFPGTRPESEAETKALVRFTASFHPKRVIELRTPGETVAVSLGRYAPASAGISREIIANSCGYRLLPPEDGFERGSFKDWFAQAGGKEGYTICAGCSSPVPDDDLEPLYTRLMQTFLLCMVV